MVYQVILNTPRLAIKTFSMENFQDFARLNQDQEVMKYFIGGAKNFRECLAKFNEILYNWNTFGYSYYAIYSQNTFIGQCGILRTIENELNFCYALHKKYWGKGLASEAGAAIIKYLFDKFGDINKITACAFEANIRSINLLKKLNFKTIRRSSNNQGVIIYFELSRDALA